MNYHYIKVTDHKGMAEIVLPAIQAGKKIEHRCNNDETADWHPCKDEHYFSVAKSRIAEATHD